MELPAPTKTNPAVLDQEQLTDLLWRRLRLEEPLDPPLDRRFRMEAPEELIIDAWHRHGQTSGFKARLVQAIRDNLGRVMQRTAGKALDVSDNEQLASLAFLTDAIGADELTQDLYKASLYAEVAEGVDEQTRFHLLRTLAGVQTGRRLIPYWQELWTSPQAGIRAIAFYGLSRANPQAALDLLPELLADQALDLPAIAWHLISNGPGPAELGKAARRLSPSEREHLKEALLAAGADSNALQAFDLQAGKATNLFPFTGHGTR